MTTTIWEIATNKEEKKEQSSRNNHRNSLYFAIQFLYDEPWRIGMFDWG